MEMPTGIGSDGLRTKGKSHMDMKEFSKENRTRCEAMNGFRHSITDWTLSDWTVAVMGELGEAANILKKLNRYRDRIPGNDVPYEALRENLADEIADTFIYLDLLSQAAGFDLSDIVRSKFDRTSQKLGYVQENK
jgi:NTP pyrophosphatase (non-canonical NTP hydrolase)